MIFTERFPLGRADLCPECHGNGWIGHRKPERLLELAQEIQDHRDRLFDLEKEYQAEKLRLTQSQQPTT